MSAQVAQTFFAIGQNYWGSGKTIAEAKRELKAAGWHRHPSVSKKDITIMAVACPRSDITVRESFELSIEWPKDVHAIKWTEQL